MRAYRIALKRFGATAKEAFNGKSGFGTDGRWHSRGRYLDYAAESRSLATLERLVHYKRFDGLEPHVIYEMEIPAELVERVSAAPAGWDRTDLLPEAQAVGNAWRDQRRSPALRVPSVISPGEHNFLLNSRHPDWSWKWISGPKAFEFEPRLMKLLQKP